MRQATIPVRYLMKDPEEREVFFSQGGFFKHSVFV